jgi:hypothetical protein
MRELVQSLTVADDFQLSKEDETHQRHRAFNFLPATELPPLTAEACIIGGGLFRRTWQVGMGTAAIIREAKPWETDNVDNLKGVSWKAQEPAHYWPVNALM